MRWTSEKETCPNHRETQGAGPVLRLQAEERGKREENGSGLCKARGSIHLRTQMETERRQLYNDVIYRSDKILCNFHVSFIVQSKPDGERKLKPVRDTFIHSFLFQCFFCKLESTESSLKRRKKKKKKATPEKKLIPIYQLSGMNQYLLQNMLTMYINTSSFFPNLCGC